MTDNRKNTRPDVAQESQYALGMAGIELPINAANHELADLLSVLWELEIPMTPPSPVFSPAWQPSV